MSDHAQSRPFPTPLPVGLFHFETPESAAVPRDFTMADLGGVAERSNAFGEQYADEPSPEPAPASPPPAAEPAWRPSREEWERQNAALEQMYADLYGEGEADAAWEAAADVDAKGARGPEYGTFDLDQNGQFMATVVDVVREHAGNLVAAERGERADVEARSIADEAARALGVPELDVELVRERARVLIHESAELYGGLTPTAARHALINAVAEQLPPLRSELDVATRISMKSGLLARLEGR